MKKSVSILLSAASVVTLAGVALAQAQSTDNLTNVNASDVPAVVNLNVPPEPTLYSDVNANVPQILPTTTPNTMTTSTGTKLTKISHPNLLKFFREIRQIGNDLFGVPIANLENKNSGIQQSGQTAAGSSESVSGAGQTAGETVKPTLSQRLEKILTPDLIKFYNVVKKEGNSLFGTLKSGVKLPNGSQEGKPAKTRPVIGADVSACVIAAIKTKDEAVIAGMTAHNASFGTAVSARGACQEAALATTEGQQEGLEKCVKDFRAALAQAKETLAKSQKDVWAAYGTALKACKPAATSSVNANTNAPVQDEPIMVEDGGNQ
jgi:hypothetical protein